jgi:hypothetical protein
MQHHKVSDNLFELPTLHPTNKVPGQSLTGPKHPSFFLSFLKPILPEDSHAGRIGFF